MGGPSTSFPNDTAVTHLVSNSSDRLGRRVAGLALFLFAFSDGSFRGCLAGCCQVQALGASSSEEVCGPCGFGCQDLPRPKLQCWHNAMLCRVVFMILFLNDSSCVAESGKPGKMG